MSERPRPCVDTTDQPDPDNLPARYIGWLAGTGDEEVFSIVLERGHAVVRRRIAGMPITLVMPIASFRGVAVWIAPDLDTMVFELAHPDPAMSLPLGRIAEVAEAARVWRRWGEVFGLPLLVVEPDGGLRDVDWNDDAAAAKGAEGAEAAGPPAEARPLASATIVPISQAVANGQAFSTSQAFASSQAFQAGQSFAARPTSDGEAIVRAFVMQQGGRTTVVPE